MYDLELLGAWDRVDYERAIRRILSSDFGDVPEDVFRRNVKSLQASQGVVLALFEDWVAGPFKVEASLHNEKLKLFIEMTDHPLDSYRQAC